MNYIGNCYINNEIKPKNICLSDLSLCAPQACRIKRATPDDL